ncbi:hypothetical protein BSK66_32330 [Paenibacillus odorifer]|uniref:ArdC-like ssDNA-binding domain-containing protein n=1 Tax=Paenibacillus TaxID=44249 RepID=UPI0003E1BEE2|nr:MULTISPECIES: ArdC-like ssDNA-binding domain-containing protein [Paenibacillus]ETT56837.1 hypothetical protein C171_17917 [Paenibacillus sp. FSL H8-237]OMD07800.1 hypothetical protein BJP47_30210 [Paenibacillus odorifer]OME46142.1 hypothetical protein BSK66_32330 [Paenibacillus odorifer]
MQTQNRIEEITSLLQEGVSMVYSSDAWRELLLFQSKFYNYSFKNMMLIYFQKPNASQIGNMKFWNSLGRRVKIGETSLRIWAPIEKKVRNDETEEEETKRTGWFLAPVYDVSQTHGKELPSLIQELSMDTGTLRGFYQTLKAACPFPVEERKLDNGVKGYFDYSTESIAVKKGLASLHKCKTLVHEMAHGLLHKETNQSRGVREVEAEGTAFVVLSYFGFDTSEYSFGYVAGWNGSKDATAIMDSGKTIQETAKRIIKQIEQQKQSEAA